MSSRSVHGFNLSFFAHEVELVSTYMEQITTWVTARKLKVASVTEFGMAELPRAHALIQSGKSIGKIVCLTEGTAAEAPKASPRKASRSPAKKRR